VIERYIGQDALFVKHVCSARCTFSRRQERMFSADRGEVRVPGHVRPAA